MHTAQLVSLVGFGALLVGCGGGSLAPGVGDDPGTGSLTLLIDADVDARPLVSNAATAADFTTEFHVRVAKGATPVTTGTVTIESAGGSVALVFGSDSGRWTGAQSGYHEVYELAVTSGDDFVDGVRVDGPALHRFTTPTAGATVDGLQALQVTWARGEAADSAVIETDQLDAIAIADTGSYIIPVGGLKTNASNAETERIRLDRSQRVTPSGAVVGSQLRVEIRNEIEILVAPTGG